MKSVPVHTNMGGAVGGGVGGSMAGTSQNAADEIYGESVGGV